MIPPWMARIMWRFTPGACLESLTFYSRQPTASNPDAATSYTIPRAQRQVIASKESGIAETALSTAELPWEIYQAAFDDARPTAAPAPNKDDWFVDSAGVTWVINSAEFSWQGQVWVLRTRRGV